MQGERNKIWKLQAGILMISLLMISATVSAGACYRTTDFFVAEREEISIEQQPQLFIKKESQPHFEEDKATDTYIEEFLDGMDVQLIEREEVGDDDLPEGGGWKSSLLINRGLYYFEDFRFTLEGVSIIEWTWFNGFEHYSDTQGYIEVWLDDADQTYAKGNFTLSAHWWGGPALFALGSGFQITWEDHVVHPVKKIHVYAERIVDDFAPEIHDQTFLRHPFLP